MSVISVLSKLQSVSFLVIGLRLFQANMRQQLCVQSAVPRR